MTKTTFGNRDKSLVICGEKYFFNRFRALGSSTGSVPVRKECQGLERKGNVTKTSNVGGISLRWLDLLLDILQFVIFGTSVI